MDSSTHSFRMETLGELTQSNQPTQIVPADDPTGFSVNHSGVKMTTFVWKNRKHAAACANNIPLLNELVLIYNSSGETHVPPPASSSSSYGGVVKTKLQQAYGKAIESIAKYPLTIESAEEAEELQGIGNFLAARIGRILRDKLGIRPTQSDDMTDVSLPNSIANTSTTAPLVSSASTADHSKPKTKKSKTAATPITSTTTDSSSSSTSTTQSSMPSTLIPILPPMAPIYAHDSLRAALAARSASSPSVATTSISTSTSVVTPVCPYGEACYRENPQHFMEQIHPSTHPLAVATPTKSNPLKRTHDQIILLSESEPEPDESISLTKKVKSHPNAAPSSSHDASDDFMSDADDDLVDLTSPPAPKMMRAVSSPTPASVTAATTSSASQLTLPPPHPSNSKPTSQLSSIAAGSVDAAAKKPKSDKLYRPKVGSSAYALLLTLMNASLPMSKSQLLQAAIAHCPLDKQTASTDLNTTLWSGMSTLITKDLVNKSLKPIQYSLTQLGRTCAQQFGTNNTVIPPTIPSPSPDDFLISPSFSPLISQTKAASSPISAAPSRSIFPSPPPTATAPQAALARRWCAAHVFDVILLIDVRERSGRKDATYMIEKLGKQGLKCEARALSVGDFMWLARHKSNPAFEVVLDTMIERKRVGDLVSSIRDGRYHEQRSRLKKTRLNRIIYVIEGRIAEDTVHGLPIKTVENVLTSMNGVHGVLVHHTPSIEPTIAFLSSLHQLLQEEIDQKGVPVILPESAIYQPLSHQQSLPNLAESPPLSPDLVGVGESFTSFSARLHKSGNLLATELFGTQLRMIRGVSASLALSIIQHYPSARALLDAYEACANEDEEENLLERMPRGPFQRSMGKAMSMKIRTFFRSKDYE